MQLSEVPLDLSITHSNEFLHESLIILILFDIVFVSLFRPHANSAIGKRWVVFFIAHIIKPKP